MRFPRLWLAGLLAVAAFSIGARPALAAAVPVIQGTQEVGIPGGGGRMLLVYGTGLTKVQSWELDEADGTLIAPLTVVFKGKSLTGLALPASLVPPAYTLPGSFSLKYVTKLATASVLVSLDGGRVADGSVGPTALTGSLRTDLDAAVTADIAAEANHAADADHADTADTAAVANALSGTLPASAFSAYDDLVAESKIGTGASQVASGTHLHDTRYPLRTDLTSAGTIDTAGNPVNWSQLVGVPTGLADGTDDTGATAYTAGAGLSLLTGAFTVNFSGTGSAVTVSRSDHDHNSVYYTQAQLNATGGTINSLSNPMDWSRLKGVPASFADGSDSDTTYTNGTGLTLIGNTFGVSFGTSSSTVAVGDHTHTGYLASTGGTVTGTITITASSGQAITATSGDTSGTVGGIDVTTAGGIGIAGHGNVGVLGDLDSDGSYGVMGRGTYPGQTGVYGTSTNNYGTGVRAYAYGTYAAAVAAYANGYGSYAIYARNQYSGLALKATTSSYYSTVVQVRGYRGSTGIRSNVGNYGYGVKSNTGYYGTGIYARTAQGGTGVYSYGGRYGTGVRARAGQYATGLDAYAGYRGTGARIGTYGSYSTGLDVRAYGYAASTLRVRGGNTRYLAVFQYYGGNVARINFKGTGYFNGGTQNYGADFAESVKVDQPVREFEPGDVMAIDVKAPRQFTLSTEANSPLVAGVISTNPAVLGSLHKVAKGVNNRTREEVPLGIVGIVPTKVCDEGGAIRIGDLLVTSSTPGHAMKAPANPAVGTVVGKALGALEAGRGKIEVLLIAR